MWMFIDVAYGRQEMEHEVECTVQQDAAIQHYIENMSFVK
jgi:hypothetical protein